MENNKNREPLSFLERIGVNLFYKSKLSTYDEPSLRVGWRCEENQLLRFQALTGIGNLTRKRVLDYGCGLGCLYGYLESRNLGVNYHGFDILKDMVEGAEKRFPDARFECRDISQDPLKGEWDYGFVSGIFNHRVKDNWGWIRWTLDQLFPLVSQGLAFNVLISEFPNEDPGFFYADPVRLESLAESIAPGKYRLVKGYLPDDMTVYLYK